jgi:hypothetical protein
MLLAFLLLFAAALSAQTFRGGVQGTVSDSSGAAVAGAQVTVASPDTGLTRTVETDADGNYTVTQLPLGTYNVTATKTGFRTQTLKGVTVIVTTSTRADLTLTPGEVKQTVEVTADLPLIETTGNTIGGTIEAERAANLPINGRDFTKLLTLVPGANADPSSVNDAPGSFGIFSINGNRGRANNYLLDGTDMNDGYRNDPAINEAGVFGTPATILPVDALENVGILSNTEAEYGRNSGATVNIVTKSGTNQLHGSVFENFRNDKLDARNFFNAKPNAKNSFHNNQFGGSLGGPVIKDRTFFFLAYEGQRETGGLPASENVPTQAMFNDFINSCEARNPGGLVGGIPPTCVINPVIQNLLDRNPWKVPGGVYPVGTDGTTPDSIQVVDPFSNRLDSAIAKIDHHFGHNRQDLFTGRYFFGDSDQSFPLALGAGSTVPGFNTITPTRVQLISLSAVHLLSPKLVLEVRGGWNRFAEGFFPEDKSFDPRTIGLVSSDGLTPRDFGLPQIRFGDGISSLGANNSIPRHRFDVNWQYFTNLAYNAGKHNWKFGYEYRRTSISQFYDLGYRSRFRFTAFSDFLAGKITGSALQFSGDARRDTFQNNQSFYVQDNFRFSRKLTLNYGVRWDYYGVIGEKQNLFSLFDPASESLVRVGTAGGPSSLYPKDYNNFSPRIGFAYDVFGSGKTVVRGGWGAYYDAFSQDFFIGHFPFNTFNPGPAYNGIGPRALQSGTLTGGDPIQSGVPLFTDFAPTTDAWTVAPNIRTPYIQNYNVNVQQDLGGHAALQVGYVGSTGKKLFRFRDINQADPATFSFQTFSGTVPFPAFTYLNQFESTATSNYNALQATLRVKTWHGLNSQVNFTWSHAVDDASDGEDYVPNAAQPDNSLNPRAEKASSNFDSRKRFTWDFTYDLPKSSRMPMLTSGWSLNGILRLSSGQPFTVHSFESFNGTGEFFERPDIVGDPFAGTKAPYTYLNLGAFAAPCTWDAGSNFCTDFTGHPGNERRNQFVGPDFRNFDFAIAKSTRLGERVEMQLRADFFNLFNHPNFANPLLPNFAVDMEFNNSVQTNPNNSLQGLGQGFYPLQATPDVGIGNPFLGGGGARNVQLALRFKF